MVDFEGNSHVSEVKSIYFDYNSTRLILSPNPCTNKVLVFSKDITPLTPFKVIDGQGREVKVNILKQTNGCIHLQHQLSKGIYVIYFPEINKNLKMVVR